MEGNDQAVLNSTLPKLTTMRSFAPVETESLAIPVRAAAFLERMDPALFAEAPEGHFWLEHLVRVLAETAPDHDRTWRLYTVPSEGEDAPYRALYAVSTETGYALFHAIDTEAGTNLLRWAIDHAPPRKVLSSYSPMQHALESEDLAKRVTRDHRELYLTLAPGELSIEPDWDYRHATEADIPRLKEYNEIYNRERRTDWTRDWRLSVARRIVYVRERNGQITSCLMRGAVITPRVALGGTFTFPEYRGQGEATMLVANFCAEMGLFGYEVCLIVDDDNLPALRVYAKVGFTPKGLYRTTYFSPPAKPPDA